MSLSPITTCCSTRCSDGKHCDCPESCFFSIPIILRSCLSAVPIQKAKDLVQENQALLNTTQPTIQDTAPSTGLKSFARGTEAHAGCQPDSFSLHHNQRGRGGRRGRGRRGHRSIPQSRRPTLLEMVRRYLRCMRCIHHSCMGMMKYKNLFQHIYSAHQLLVLLFF